MSVEFALLTPAFIVLMLLLVLGGRVIEAQGQVDGAARDAARAASVQDDRSYVSAAITNAVDSDLETPGHNLCPDGLRPQWAGGTGTGVVSITLQCTINVGFFPGLGALTITGHAVAPLDTYVERNW